MDKVKVKVVKLDGTTIEVEGSPEEVARILRDLDRQQMAPQPQPTIIVIPAPAQPHPLTVPVTPGPIWAPSPTVAPSVPGWPIITCEYTSRPHLNN